MPLYRWRYAMLVPRRRQEAVEKVGKEAAMENPVVAGVLVALIVPFLGNTLGAALVSPHAPWHVRALHQGAFGLRRRRHDRRQRVEPHHAGAGGGRGRARAGVGAGCRGLSRRHAAAFGHRPLHAASARGLRRAGGARHHVEEAHDDVVRRWPSTTCPRAWPWAWCWRAFWRGIPPSRLPSVVALSLGIAIQNVPEGAVVSLPLTANGMSRPQARFSPARCAGPWSRWAPCSWWPSRGS